MPILPTWEALVPEIVNRHRVLDLELVPWFKRPAHVRIAIYAEGSIQFRGGSFDGLQHVVAALRSDPWPWVVFEPVLIHRNADPTADQQNKTLDQIDLSHFDELWLFGFSGGSILSPAELTAVHQFMDKGGGVLHTGDHADLGQGIGGAIKRAGAMRRYPAPAATPGVWNNTLRPGPNGVYEFDDQSDDIPQTIRLRWYYSWSSTITPPILRRRSPHPLLCGATGVIGIFPDHQHEGEALAPAANNTAVWPSVSGYQPTAEVIAWGRVDSPDAGQSREIGLVSAYDGHSANVGRIVADSTWHHWFDINLKGFDLTPSGQDTLTKIERYYLNVAAWLAPNSKQGQMRNGSIIIALRRDPLVMLDAKALDPFVFAALARDALGQIAPQCLVRQWILDHLPPLLLRKPPRIIDPDPPPFNPGQPFLQVPLPIEDLMLATVMAPLVEEQTTIRDAVSEFREDMVNRAFEEALPKLALQLQEQAQTLREFEHFTHTLQTKRQN